jgi:phage-related protein
MANENNAIAQAYVQIMPTTKGLKENLEKAFSENGASSGKSFSASFGNALKGLGSVAAGIGSAAAAGLGAASAAVGALGKQALDAYANYEQLEGGVQTLFGDAQQKVLNNAAGAFEKAGMSSNQYMETVTSFSASLIQSLGGDTDKAADVANRAIIDMADNANKMGTSMEAIQNAYQGFAKQNYTMLDNLKLGYGGTKEEMERLLQDAATISGVNYDISSFADIATAIGVIQDKMGIANATQEEGATTISGSLGMLKASWENLVTGFGREDAPLDGLVENLMQSVGAVSDNIFPALQRITTAIGKALPQLVTKLSPMISKTLPELLIAILPAAISAATSIIMAIEQNWPTIITAILPALTEGIEQIGQMILTLLPILAETGLQILLTIANGIGESLPTLIPQIVNVMLAIVDVLTDSKNLSLLLDAAISIITGLTLGIAEALPILIEKIPMIIEKIEVALSDPTALTKLFDAAGLIILKLGEGLIYGIPKLLECLGSIMYSLGKGAIVAINAVIDRFKEAGTMIVQGIWNGIQNAKDWIVEKIKSFGQSVIDIFREAWGIHSPSAVMAEMGNFMGEGLAEGIAGSADSVMASVGGLNDDIKQGFNGELNGVLSGSPAAVGTTTAQTSTASSSFDKPITIELNIGGQSFGRLVVDSINELQRKAGRVVLEV